MRPQYDAVVIGAGPAGSMAAREIADAGFEVLMLEKHARPGYPLCCAEGVSKPALDHLLEVNGDWISAYIEHIKVIDPNGGYVDVHHPGAGYILDRKKFDDYLAHEAVRAGSTFECEAIGIQLIGTHDLFHTIEVLKPGNEVSYIKASIFIAADGVESKIARLAGVENQVEFSRVESLLQYRVEEIAIQKDTVEFYVGNSVAPGGYVWVFPKSANAANVGLGITTKKSRGPELEARLNDFIKKRFGNARITEKACGIVPKYQGKSMFRKANLLVAGDAARVLDSLTGAGIINAMLSGRYAGQAAVHYLNRAIDKLDDIDRLYPAKFLDEKGEELILYKKLKDVYNHLNDRDFIEIIQALREYFDRHQAQGIKAAGLLVNLIKTRPRLLRLVRHLI